MSNQPTVFIVDDDDAMRSSLCELMESVHQSTEAYDNAQSFLDAFSNGKRGCVVVDVRMPGMSGLELHQELLNRGVDLPVIVISGHGDIPMAVRAIKLGAIDFIEKPFRAQVLLERIQHALRIEAKIQRRRDDYEPIKARLETLTPRERQVLQLVVAGRSSKQIAYDLKLSAKTVRVHRSRFMAKMQAESVVDLVRLAEIERT